MGYFLLAIVAGYLISSGISQIGDYCQSFSRVCLLLRCASAILAGSIGLLLVILYLLRWPTTLWQSFDGGEQFQIEILAQIVLGLTLGNVLRRINAESIYDAGSRFYLQAGTAIGLLVIGFFAPVLPGLMAHLSSVKSPVVELSFNSARQDRFATAEAHRESFIEEVAPDYLAGQREKLEQRIHFIEALWMPSLQATDAVCSPVKLPQVAPSLSAAAAWAPQERDRLCAFKQFADVIYLLGTDLKKAREQGYGISLIKPEVREIASELREMVSAFGRTRESPSTPPLPSVETLRNDLARSVAKARTKVIKAITGSYPCDQKADALCDNLLKLTKRAVEITFADSQIGALLDHAELNILIGYITVLGDDPILALEWLRLSDQSDPDNVRYDQLVFLLMYFQGHETTDFERYLKQEIDAAHFRRQEAERAIANCTVSQLCSGQVGPISEAVMRNLWEFEIVGKESYVQVVMEDLATGSGASERYWHEAAQYAGDLKEIVAGRISHPQDLSTAAYDLHRSSIDGVLQFFPLMVQARRSSPDKVEVNEILEQLKARESSLLARMNQGDPRLNYTRQSREQLYEIRFWKRVALQLLQI